LKISLTDCYRRTSYGEPICRAQVVHPVAVCGWGARGGCRAESAGSSGEGETLRRIAAQTNQDFRKNEFASLPTEFATVGKISLQSSPQGPLRMRVASEKKWVCQFATLFERGGER